LEKTWLDVVKETDRQLIRRMDVAAPAENVVRSTKGGLFGMFRGGQSSSSEVARRIRAQLRVKPVESYRLSDITEDLNEEDQLVAGSTQGESAFQRFFRDQRTWITMDVGGKIMHLIGKIALSL
jgi:hypothetical protein